MKFIIYFLFPLVVSCTLLTDMAAKAVMGGSDKGGINTELVVGDKEQVLGTNLDVKAQNIGKVTGTSDNSVTASNAKEVTVNNNEFPWWAIGLLIILAWLVGYLMRRPRAWKHLIERKTNEQ